jgi:hypothetical protein
MAETWTSLAAQTESDASLLSALSELEFERRDASYELPSALNLYDCLRHGALPHGYQGSLLKMPSG